MRSERPCPVQTPTDGASTNDESSPSWASCSSTPSFSTSGLDFEFNQKCTVSEESLQFRSSSSDQLSSSEHYLGRSTRAKGSRSSYDGELGSGGAPLSPDCVGQTSNTPPSGATTTVSINRFTHLLRRAESVAPPAHAQFLRKPVSKTKSADIACDEPRKKTLAQDVRLRLGFLRRRNTDTSIRPPPEEAQKWAQSFVELTNSKYGLALFRAFLSREFSEENIDFWLAVEEYKKSRPHKLASKARRIYEDFVAVQAPKEVNLEAATRNAIQENLDNVDVHMFDQAQRRVQGLMEQDAYIRFLQCDLYQDLLKQ